MSKTSFTITDGRLTKIDHTLLKKKVKVYEICKMEELEVEPIMVKKFFAFKEPTGNYEVTFIYGEDTVELDARMAKVEANVLLNAILAATDICIN